jgi:hypothetical protein
MEEVESACISSEVSGEVFSSDITYIARPRDMLWRGCRARMMLAWWGAAGPATVGRL